MHKKSLQRKAFFTFFLSIPLNCHGSIPSGAGMPSRTGCTGNWSSERLGNRHGSMPSPKSGTGISARGMQDTAYESSWNTTPALPVRRPFLSA